MLKGVFIVLVCRGANTPVDPEGEERKGGAQGIAKAFLSAGDDRLCIYLHVPENLSKVGSGWLSCVLFFLMESLF